MAPSVKLAVISKVMKRPRFYKNQLVFCHLLYTLVEKQPYLMSLRSSYQLSVNSILLLMCVRFYWC